MTHCGTEHRNGHNHNDFNLPVLVGNLNNATVPNITEWEQLWRYWDVVTSMINHDTMLFEQPIGLRHPFIFYLGHIPAFLDIMLTRHKADPDVMNEHQPLTEPTVFADIFERGIDPDMDDPNQCNPHSLVPIDRDGWPSIKSLLKYQQCVRNRLKLLLSRWEIEDEGEDKDSSENYSNQRRRAGHVVWMCFEHEAMHLETLLYMLVQSSNIIHPAVSPPLWYENRCLKRSDTSLSIISQANLIPFNGSIVEIGSDESEESSDLKKINLGWDNEHPKRMVSVSSFEIQTRPVTNGEYFLFWKKSNRSDALTPASWHFEQKDSDDELPKVKTSFGLCDLHYALNWPAQVSCEQAEAYATNVGMRLPTEPEWIHFRRSTKVQHAKLNYGFKSWTPQPLDNERVHVIGDVWEWTSSVWEYYDGFASSKLYPGYSSDFFDGKHRVVLGASWATHPRIAERISFRNWYQWRYPYVFCGFRLCKSISYHSMT